MSPDKHNGHNPDELLRLVLKDDLPPETELGMKGRMSAFRRTAESSAIRYGASRDPLPGMRS